MTAVRVQDPLLVKKDGTDIGRAQTIDFVGSAFTVTSTSNESIQVSLTSTSSGSTAMGVVPVWNEIPSGSIDGMNMVFTVLHEPVDKNFMLFQNGRLLSEGMTKDFVLSGSTISMMTAPLTCDSLMSSYLMATIMYTWNEVPSGTIDASSRDFYLEYTPISTFASGFTFPSNNSGTLMLFFNGIMTTKDRDYTLTGAHIALTSSFTTNIGDQMLAFYERTL